MRPLTILFIDDDTDDLEIALAAVDTLSGPLTCATMTSATEALEKLETKQINPQLIFLDLNMPIMSGEQFLMEIKKRDGLKHIPVVILSTTSNPVTITLAKKLGAIGFISKPTKFDELIRQLSAFIYPDNQ